MYLITLVIVGRNISMLTLIWMDVRLVTQK